MSLVPTILAVAIGFLTTAEVDQLSTLAPNLEEAADLSGERATLLTAIVALESRGDVRAEARGAVWGPGQISWWDWAALLREEGVAEEAPDLLDPRDGTVAIGLVLEDLRKKYGRRWPKKWRDHGVLCLYAHGSPALNFTRGCARSRAFLGVEQNLVRAMERSPETVLVAER